MINFHFGLDIFTLKSIYKLLIVDVKIISPCILLLVTFLIIKVYKIIFFPFIKEIGSLKINLFNIYLRKNYYEIIYYFGK